MFEGIKRNIRETLRDLRRLDIGRTLARLRAARVHANRKKRARREFLDVRDEALDEWERLIAAGRSRDDEHLRNLHHRARKADHWADENGQLRADFARLARRLKRLVRRKNEARKRLERDLRSARKNLRQHRRAFERSQQPTSGVGSFDSKPVAVWMIPILISARNNGWGGTLTSGYRSPEYSEQLCYGICDAPVCPGRCAGRTSNHTKNVKPEGAVDVSDPAGFAQAQSTLRNALGAADPWHYSVSGG